MTIVRGSSNHITSIDNLGHTSKNTLFGEIITAERHINISVLFSYNNSVTQLKTAVTANGGTVTNNTSEMVVSSSTATNGTAEIQSLDSIRYRPGQEAFAHFSAQFTTPKANSYQYIGCMTTSDGFFVGYNGTTFVCGRRKGGVETLYSTFSEDLLDGTGRSQFKIDTTKINAFKITWGYHGILPITWEVYGGLDVGWIPFHLQDFTNISTSLHHDLPYLPIKIEVGNTGNNTAMIIRTGAWAGGTTGATAVGHVGDRHYAIDNTKSVTTLINVLTIKSATTFASKTNQIRTSLALLSASATNTGVNTTTIRVYRNATLGGSPSYTDISATDSIISYDTAGTTITGGTLLATYAMSQDGQILNKYNGDTIFLYPADTLTFAAVASGGTSVVAVGINWSEEF